MESHPDVRLAAIADARAAAADRLVTPLWYHPILGALLAGYVVGVSFGGTAVRFAAVVLFAASAAALAHAYRTRTGVWVSGLNAGRASRWAMLLGALIGVVLIAAMIISTFTDLRWPVWALAFAAFIGTIGIGRRFDAALRAQLRTAA